jgi:small subunit ribosomal protein S18
MVRRGKRRKVSVLELDKVEYIDYKDVRLLRQFLTERGKIIPRRLSGATAKNQRQLTVAIKRARSMALLPYVSD